MDQQQAAKRHVSNRLGNAINSPLAAAVIGHSKLEEEVTVAETWQHVCRIFKIRDTETYLASRAGQSIAGEPIVGPTMKLSNG